MQEFKIRVNEEQSRIVQEKLFEMGYTWSDGETDVIHEKENFLCFWKASWETKPSLAYHTSEENFEIKDKRPEITFEEFINLTNNETTQCTASKAV